MPDQLGPAVDPYWPPVEADPTYGHSYPPVPFLRRRRRWVKWVVVLGTIAVCCLGTIGGIVAVLGPALTGPVSHQAGLEDPVRDGKFEFVVNSVSCAHRTVATGPLSKAAQGQFCLVKLSVSNIGREAQTFSDGFQKAVGPTGTRYDADSGAGLLVNPGGTATWNLINPGNAISAVLVFDIPATAEISTLELHDSAFSRGVIVTL